MGVQGLGPFRGIVRKFMFTNASSIRVLVELGVELRIALDGLGCPRQGDNRNPWIESTHIVVIAHTQASQP